ncbi:MAG: signal recognition particle-docking protein FtsY, partial [Deltaproteobacteria bacterium]|nr:signal recognition particle-docking protein FtsY [Deltaproteobacteria bacterium]
RLAVVMVVGVNGVGKTTTIAKLAHRFRRDGQRPLLVAADTFRAAAIDQLRIWADRIGVPCIAKAPGADAAAVAFDGVAAGVARKAHVVLIDTSGRLHTKTPLMEELKKVKRVMGKALADAPHEIWCVLDATTGQNAIAQVREFHAALGLTGLVVAKYDGTAKAGALFAVARAASLPIRFLGTGEQVTDLAAFAPERFVDRLLA